VYWFLLRPKWLAFLAGCVALAIVFVELGFWQLRRLDQRKAQNARIIAGRVASPVPPSALFGPGRPPAAGNEFRAVRIEGSYDQQHEYLVRGQTLDQAVGVYVLTPMVLGDGGRVLVLRGFVPYSDRGADVAPEVPAPPTGPVTVTGRLRLADEPGSRLTRIGKYQTAARISIREISADLGRPLYDGYTELVKQLPPPVSGLALVPEPELTEGPHLAYAVQWFLFSGMLFVGYAMYARREAERVAEEQAGPDVPDGLPAGDTAVGGQGLRSV
jgi:cytochrome oxidase assembly protein ShyY1